MYKFFLGDREGSIKRNWVASLLEKFFDISADAYP